MAVDGEVIERLEEATRCIDAAARILATEEQPTYPDRLVVSFLSHAVELLTLELSERGDVRLAELRSRVEADGKRIAQLRSRVDALQAGWDGDRVDRFVEFVLNGIGAPRHPGDREAVAVSVRKALREFGLLNDEGVSSE